MDIILKIQQNQQNSTKSNKIQQNKSISVMYMLLSQNKYNYMQVIATIIGGYIGALIPNKLSNIPHLLMAVIIGSLVSKVVYGDFDVGYQWTQSDIYYWFVTVIEALIGGYLAVYAKKISNK